MNSFAQHNIQHLSPSQINTWIADPAAWVLQKLYGCNWPSGFAAKRGVAIENAIVNVLMNGHTEEQAIALALEEYDRFGVLSTDPKKDKERLMIEPCVVLGLAELRQYGRPVFPEGGKQHRIEINCVTDGFTIPIMGYLDLVYPERKLVIDIKTTGRRPSEMSMAHARQAAIYEKAMPGYDVKFLYITPKKVQIHSCSAPGDTLAEIKAHVLRMERFLAVSDDKNILASIVPLNPETYYWDTPEAVRDRKQYYGV